MSVANSMLKSSLKGLRSATPFMRTSDRNMARHPLSIGTLPKLFAATIVLMVASERLLAQTPSFVAPPRSIADVAAILEQEKPNAEYMAKQKAKADAPVSGAGDPSKLPLFYFDRGAARARLGRLREATADLEAAEKLAQEQRDQPLFIRAQVQLGFVYGWSGDSRSSLRMFRQADQSAKARGNHNYNAIRWTGMNLIALGDLDGADAAMQRNRDAIAIEEKNPGWATDKRRNIVEAHLQFGNAAILEARGDFRGAAAAYEQAEQLYTASLADSTAGVRTNNEQVIYWMAARAGRVKAHDGRMIEAEIDVRRALTGWLKLSTKYDLNTARIINVFASILLDQGRYAEAESMIRAVIEIYQNLGVDRDSDVYAIGLNQLATILSLQEKWTEAAKTYADLDAATKDMEPARKDEISLGISRVFSAYNTGQVNSGIATAERLVNKLVTRFGEKHVDTLLARCALAAGQFRAGHNEEALRDFRASANALLSTAHSAQGGDDGAVNAAARDQMVQSVIESYIALLATRHEDSTAESFRLAEAIRGRSVQKALAASSARTVAQDPALAGLARTEQDLQKQIGAQLGLLTNVLALPPAQREEKGIVELRAQIEKLRAEHEKVWAQLTRQFPEYADLIDPKPPTIDGIKAALRPGEALLSFYFGIDKSFVWALRKGEPVAFSAIALSAAEVEKKIIKLREALEPSATTIAEIPAFDLALSHELYTQLLKPVEAGWKPAKSLIVVTNGAMGLLPLGLLTTAPATLKTDGAMFAGYRDVPWLARTHAVTMVPSAAALRTLRNLPPGSDQRERMIGFGDPLFSTAQAAEAVANAPPVQLASATRGVPLARRAAPQTNGVQSAELALLPRLPDTAEELKSIALALQADPDKALRLGKAANEDAVKHSDLSNYRIVVFATHGLVPGELDGLTQPALALSAPEVAGVPGDGLLTMEEILSLKLNADWVVLSACNTGTGAGAGAEAASGLGRAFFYAGTRAILVTNWSVHSASARELVTDVFRRQTANAGLTRGEALRQASMALADGECFKDDGGKPVFSYAHPLFWAPYTIIGDGG